MADLVFNNDPFSSPFIHDYTVNERRKTFDYGTPFGLIASMSLHFKDTLPNIIALIAGGDGQVEPTTASTFMIERDGLLIDVTFDTKNSSLKDLFGITNRSVELRIHGSVLALEQFYREMESNTRSKDIYVHWYFKDARGDLCDVAFPLANDEKVFRTEHYPFISEIETFSERFNESNANILILLGDPGTGKTSFIRNLLRASSKESFVTYDEKVMADDQLYINFLSRTHAQYLILEDSDLLLTDRLTDGNRTMSKILNAADGLVSFKEKKIIFTANIRDKAKIDEALIRPGRCFDILNFRALTKTEANVVAEVNGLPPVTGHADQTLAEVFNR